MPFYSNYIHRRFKNIVFIFNYRMARKELKEEKITLPFSFGGREISYPFTSIGKNLDNKLGNLGLEVRRREIEVRKFEKYGFVGLKRVYSDRNGFLNLEYEKVLQIPGIFFSQFGSDFSPEETFWSNGEFFVSSEATGRKFKDYSYGIENIDLNFNGGKIHLDYGGSKEHTLIRGRIAKGEVLEYVIPMLGLNEVSFKTLNSRYESVEHLPFEERDFFTVLNKSEFSTRKIPRKVSDIVSYIAKSK